MVEKPEEKEASSSHNC